MLRNIVAGTAALAIGLGLGAYAFLQSSVANADPTKVGFVYVGPIGDLGWTYRHDIGRLAVEEAFGDDVETTYLEMVSEGPAATQQASSPRRLPATDRSGMGICLPCRLRQVG